MKLTNNDHDLLNQFAYERNLKEKTLTAYKYTISKYTTYFMLSFTELLQEAEQEEENGVRWKDSKLKQRLLEYRHHTYLNDYENTANNHFARIKALYKHYDIMIGDLPRLNKRTSNKNQPLQYKDLPTIKELKLACEMSNQCIRSLILFICSSGCARAEALSLTIGDFINATQEYHNGGNINKVLDELQEQEGVVPVWSVRRIKTNKYYTTFSSPESVESLIHYLLSRDDRLTNDSELFHISDGYVGFYFNKLNRDMGLGMVNGYGRLRTHTLRKFHASRLYNSGLSMDTVDSLQGRGKSSTRSSYFMEDTHNLKSEYIRHMGCLLVNSSVREVSVESMEYKKLVRINKKREEQVNYLMRRLNEIEELINK